MSGRVRWRAAMVAEALLLLTGCTAAKIDKTLHGDALKDPASCTPCHADHVTQWSGSMHAYAADDPVFLAMNARGQRETKGALGDFCVKCHAPVALAAGATKDGTNLAALPAHLKGVTCYFCHSVASVEGSHNNPLALGDDEVMRAAIEDPLDNPAHEAEYSPWLDRSRRESASLCGSCHDIVTPKGVALERTFSEWQTSQFGNGMQAMATCGNCHMAGKKAPAADFPGVKVRTVHDHDWPGVDVALTSFPRQKEQRAAVERAVAETLYGQVCVSPPLADVNVDVVLENATAGHNFPSGAAQDRRLWVELVGYQADKLIFSSGVAEPGKPIAALDDPQLQLFRDTIFDSGGKEVHMFWDAASYQSTLLTPAPDPSHKFSVAYKFPLSAGIPDRVTLRVYLQPMGTEVLQSLVDSGDLDPKYRDAMPTYTALSVEWKSTDGHICVPPK